LFCTLFRDSSLLFSLSNLLHLLSTFFFAEQQKQVGAKRDLPDHIKDGLSKYEGIGEATTALPTMWMGSQNE
jgi:hypothetical protein